MFPINITEKEIKNESALNFLHERNADLDVTMIRRNDPNYAKFQRQIYRTTQKLSPCSSATLAPYLRSNEVRDMFPKEIRPDMRTKVPPYRKNIQQSIEEFGKENSTDTSLQLVGGPAVIENNNKEYDILSIEEFEVPLDLAGYSLKKQGNKITCNGRVVEPLKDSSSLLIEGEENALYERFKTDGYLCFRKLLSGESILKSKAKIYGGLRKMGLADENDLALSKTGWTLETKYGTVISGTSEFSDDSDVTETERWKKIGNNEEIESICNSNSLRVVLSMLSSGKSRSDKCQNEPRTFDPNYTWMRIKAPGECTVNHADLFYFRDSTKMFSHPGTDREYGNIADINFENDADDEEKEETNYSSFNCCHCNDGSRDDKLLLCDECNAPYHMDTCLNPPIDITPKDSWFCPTCNKSRPTLGTCWIPLGDVDIDHGVLAVLAGSHYLPNFEAKLKNSQAPKSFFTKSQFNRNLVWKTGKFNAGDCIFFDSKLIHCTGKNYQQTYRMSLDFRWYIEPTGRTNCNETNQGKFVRTVSRAFNAPRHESRRFQDDQKELFKIIHKNEYLVGGKAKVMNGERRPNNPSSSSSRRIQKRAPARIFDKYYQKRNAGKFSDNSSSNILQILSSSKNESSLDDTNDANENYKIVTPVDAVRPYLAMCDPRKEERKYNSRRKHATNYTTHEKFEKMVNVAKASVERYEHLKKITFPENVPYVQQVSRNKGIKFKPDLKDLEFSYLLSFLSERDTI